MAALGGDPSDYWFQRPTESPLPAMQLGLQAYQARVRQDLERKQLANQTAQTMLELQKGQAMLDAKLKSEQGMTELNAFVSQVAKDEAWTDPQRISKFWSIVSRYPQIPPSVVDNVAGVFSEAQKRKDKLAELQLGATTGIVEAKQADEWLQEANLAYARGDKERGDRLKNKAAMLAPKGFAFETFTDESGRQQFRLSQGLPAGTLGGAAATIAQKQLLGLETGISMLADLESNLRGKDLGVRGVLGEQLDRWLPQIGLSSVDLERTDNRTKLKAAVQQMVRIISTDERFSNEDRRRAEAVMPSAGWGENVEHARQTIKTLQRIFRERAFINAKALGKEAPEWSLSLDELARRVQSKQITREKALELIKQYGITE